MKKKENCISFAVNTKIYSLECVLNAVYSYLDRVYIFIDGNPDDKLKVILRGKDGLTPAELTNVFGDFNNELVNQLFRLKLAKKNKKIREYIIGKALFGTNSSSFTVSQPVNSDDLKKEEEELDKMLDEELKSLEEEEARCKTESDPLGILNSWESGKNKAKKNPAKKGKKKNHEKHPS
jgi:His-Xaa-Ser system protein HxsD